MGIQDMRQEYGRDEIRRAELDADPIQQFRGWFQHAQDSVEIHEPNAMTLCTADREGRPHGRIVLLKDVEDDGFVFYSNYESDKARDLADNPRAALVFHWDKLERQVRIDGRVEQVRREQTEKYFASRPRKSQLGAWASRQSEVVTDRETLQHRFAELEAQYEGKDVPTPPQWGGYRVLPESIEFWQGQRSRLHDRLRYRLESGKWMIERLSP